MAWDRLKRAVVVAIMALGALPGCGEPWTVLVTSPENGAEVAPDSDKVSVRFEAPGLRLGNAEECGERTDCGEAQLTLYSRERISQSEMIEKPCVVSGQRWNSRGTTKALEADLSLCADRPGVYVIRVGVVRHLPAAWPESERIIALSDEVEFSVPAER